MMHAFMHDVLGGTGEDPRSCFIVIVGTSFLTFTCCSLFFSVLEENKTIIWVVISSHQDEVYNVVAFNVYIDVRHGMASHGTARHGTVLCGTVLCGTVCYVVPA